MTLRGKNPDRDGKIEAGSLFFDICGGKIDGGTPHMGSETGIADGGVNSVLALLHSGIRKAYNDDTGIPMPGIDFNFNGLGIHPVNRAAVNLG